MPFNPEISDYIYNKICEGWTKVKIAKALNISARTIYYWAKEFPDFKKRLDEARYIQIENLMDEIIDIADDENIDTARAALKIRARKTLSHYHKPATEIKEAKQPVFLGLSIVPPKEIEDVSPKVVESERPRLLSKPK